MQKNLVGWNWATKQPSTLKTGKQLLFITLKVASQSKTPLPTDGVYSTSDSEKTAQAQDFEPKMIQPQESPVSDPKGQFLLFLFQVLPVADEASGERNEA